MLKEPILSPAEPPPAPGAAERIRKAPAADLDLKNAPVSEFAGWLHQAGLNVVVDPEAMDERVTCQVSGVRPAAALSLVLKPTPLSFRLLDGTVHLVKERSPERSIRTCLIDARDVGLTPFDFTREPDPGAGGCDFEDLCNLIKNTVQRGEWEEAEGRSIMNHRGFIILRNREEVIRECVKFVEERRGPASRRVALRADLAVVPAEALGDASGPVVDARERDRLLAAGSPLERLSWVSYENQRSLFEWERARDYLYDTGREDALLRACPTSSWIEVRPTLDPEGRTFGVNLWFRDHWMTGVRDEKVGRGSSRPPP